MSVPAQPSGVKEAQPVVRGAISDFDLSPDGAKVVYTASAGGKNTIFLVDAKGGESKKLTDDGDYSEPRFSPQIKK